MSQRQDDNVQWLQRELGAIRARARNMELELELLCAQQAPAASGAVAAANNDNAIIDNRPRRLSHNDAALAMSPQLQRTGLAMRRGASIHNRQQGQTRFAGQPRVAFSPPQQQQQQQQQQSSASQAMRRSVSNRSEPGMQPAWPRRMNPSRHGLPPSAAQSAQYLFPTSADDLGLLDVGINPGDYLTTSALSMGKPYLDSTGTGFSPNDICRSLTPTAPPSMISASSAPDAPVPMTRDNSALSNIAGIGMIRRSSYASQNTDIMMEDDTMGSSSTGTITNSEWKAGDHSQSLMAIGESFPYSMPPQEYQSMGLNPNMLFAPDMERSESATSGVSIKSTSSVRRRAREALERTVINGRASIAPKPNASPGGRSSGKHGKVALSKSKYRRPVHPKVVCTLCNDHPEGFRGEHELRRHVNAKHKVTVTKYVCRDAGSESNVEILYPLSKCKACSSGKQYGAYYNAAAHLRRTHFKPKPTRGKGKARSEDKRGGKGGGDWPAMCDLKPWFAEVQVEVDQSGGPILESGRNEDVLAEIEESPHEIDPVMLFNQSNGGMGQLNFGEGSFGMSVGQSFSSALSPGLNLGESLMAAAPYDPSSFNYSGYPDVPNAAEYAVADGMYGSDTQTAFTPSDCEDLSHIASDVDLNINIDTDNDHGMIDY